VLDSCGKYLSHIAFVDMDRSLRNILNVSQDPVIRLGNPGTFDEHGIFPLNVLADSGKVFGYIGGWNRRVSVSVDGAIGLALSEDGGVTFIRVGEGPILAASVTEPFLIGDPFVLRIDDTFHMWYIFGTRWIKDSGSGLAERVYKIGHAVSVDNRNFERTGVQIVQSKKGENECQALPTVLIDNGVLHMIFCYREAFGFRSDTDKGYHLGYASSVDGRSWKRDDDHLRLETDPGAWDSDMQCYPHLFRVQDRVYLLYNGNNFGRHGFGLAELQRDP
jgi:predicted GH43/DUF377 family glycosyl hydrolase